MMFEGLLVQVGHRQFAVMLYLHLMRFTDQSRTSSRSRGGANDSSAGDRTGTTEGPSTEGIF